MVEQVMQHAVTAEEAEPGCRQVAGIGLIYAGTVDVDAMYHDPGAELMAHPTTACVDRGCATKGE